MKNPFKRRPKKEFQEINAQIQKNLQTANQVLSNAVEYENIRNELEAARRFVWAVVEMNGGEVQLTNQMIEEAQQAGSLLDISYDQERGIATIKSRKVKITIQ